MGLEYAVPKCWGSRRVMSIDDVLVQETAAAHTLSATSPAAIRSGVCPIRNVGSYA
jgi:hypothetical protein